MATIVRLTIPKVAAVGRAEPVLFWLWLIPASLAPVWFGSTLPLVWGVHALIFGLVLMVYGITAAISGEMLPVPLSRLVWPLAAISLLLLWALIQTSHRVPLSWQHPVWELAAPVVGSPVAGAISLDPAATDRAMLWTATVAANLLLAVQFARRPDRSWTILVALVIVSGAIALYGLIVYLLGNHWILWLPKFAYPTALTATFVNRNNYAAYSGISLICTIGLILRSLHSGRLAQRPKTQRVARVILLGVIALMLCFVLALTGSRAGAAVTLLGIGVLALLQLSLHSRRWGFLVIGMILTVAAIIFMLPVGNLVIERLANVDQDFMARLAVDRRVVDGINASPWLGYGYGAFKQAFPMFRDWTIPANAVWEYAHDDWLEALFTLGIPAGLLLWFVAVWALTRSFAGIRQHHHDSIYAASAAGACALVMAHSMIDFSSQIQGIAIPLTTMIGVGLVQSWVFIRQRGERFEHRQRLSMPRRTTPSQEKRSVGAPSGNVNAHER